MEASIRIPGGSWRGGSTLQTRHRSCSSRCFSAPPPLSLSTVRPVPADALAFGVCANSSPARRLCGGRCCSAGCQHRSVRGRMELERDRLTFQAAMPAARVGRVSHCPLYLAIYPMLAVGRRGNMDVTAACPRPAWLADGQSPNGFRATMFTGFAWNPVALRWSIRSSSAQPWIGTYGLSHWRARRRPLCGVAARLQAHGMGRGQRLASPCSLPPRSAAWEPRPIRSSSPTSVRRSNGTRGSRTSRPNV